MDNQNTCNVCNKSFNSDQELREHQRNTHQSGTGTGKKDQSPSGELNQPNREQHQPNRGEQNPQQDRGEKKIAS
jgi:C2H2-type zinc finger protein